MEGTAENTFKISASIRQFNGKRAGGCMRTWKEAACFSPPAYVCVGRRVLIHKQSVRGFSCSRQSLQALPGTSGPNCVSADAAVADSAIVLFPAHVGQRPTHPLILLGTPTPFQMRRPALHPSSASQVPHSIPSQGVWQTQPGAPGLPEKQSWEGSLSCRMCKGSFPSWGQGIGAGNRNV